MFVILTGPSVTNHSNPEWTAPKVVTRPGSGSVPFRTFAEAFDYADEFLVDSWAIAQLDLSVSKP